MKKLIFKSLMFAGGILIVISALPFIPLSTFTFRSWESILWGTDLKPTVGKFYPNRTIRRTESGDLGHGSRYQVLKKDILWKTDRFGFRNDPVNIKDYPVVLVGDSNIVGTGTSQEFILSEQLSHKLNVPVYNYSPMVLDGDLMRNLAIMRIRPKLVICEAVGPGLGNASFKKNHGIVVTISKTVRDIFNSGPLLWLEIALDRFWKREPVRFLQSRVDSALGVLPMPVIIGPSGMLFTKESVDAPLVSDAEIERTARALKKVSDALASRGIGFVFIPVPDKESIHFEELPLEARERFLNRDFFPKFKKALDREGVRSVDLYPAFRGHAGAGERLYFSDDKHWNERGVAIASELIAQELAS